MLKRGVGCGSPSPEQPKARASGHSWALLVILRHVLCDSYIFLKRNDSHNSVRAATLGLTFCERQDSPFRESGCMSSCPDMMSGCQAPQLPCGPSFCFAEVPVRSAVMPSDITEMLSAVELHPRRNRSWKMHGTKCVTLWAQVQQTGVMLRCSMSFFRPSEGLRRRFCGLHRCSEALVGSMASDCMTSICNYEATNELEQDTARRSRDSKCTGGVQGPFCTRPKQLFWHWCLLGEAAARKQSSDSHSQLGTHVCASS